MAGIIERLIVLIWAHHAKPAPFRHALGLLFTIVSI